MFRYLNIKFMGHWYQPFQLGYQYLYLLHRPFPQVIHGVYELLTQHFSIISLCQFIMLNHFFIKSRSLFIYHFSPHFFPDFLKSFSPKFHKKTRYLELPQVPVYYLPNVAAIPTTVCISLFFIINSFPCRIPAARTNITISVLFIISIKLPFSF